MPGVEAVKEIQPSQLDGQVSTEDWTPTGQLPDANLTTKRKRITAIKRFINNPKAGK